MTISRFASVAVIASFLFGTLPSIAWAEEGSARATASVDLRASIDHAVARLTSERPQSSEATKRSRSTSKAMQGPVGGGGGGASRWIWTLVGTAASLGTTYYVMKQIRKQTDQASQQ